ncbi:hypothetical protein DH2020_045849 [Rehmannia glutinosa]|uniref:DNA-directed RNA polymerase III subunit RPC4 n=1 Tax=Rehmannia glutinosa TaxID=99300 RepID=A0ABR0UCW5_REHGL
MDQDSTTKAPRKVRFAPKAPPKREQKPVLPKVEKVENDSDGAIAEQLLRRYNLGLLKLHLVMEDHLLPSGGAGQRVEKEYKEPWDYYTYYPVTLPLRRPYSGNPELLDEEEFGEDPQISAYDENATNSAEELGLLDENVENNMFFLQLPKTLPMIKPPADAEGQNQDNNANPTKNAGDSQKTCNLEELPAGFMGKMLVYKSGAIKLKLGDILYDVDPGLNCVFGQDVFAVNTEEKHCCNMGELNKRAVITPDVDSMAKDSDAQVISHLQIACTYFSPLLESSLAILGREGKKFQKKK